MFYSILRELCTKKGIPVTKLAENIGLSSAIPSAWKKGTMPNTETLKRIADYFEISTDYLLYGTERHYPSPVSEKCADYQSCEHQASLESSREREIGRLEGRIVELEKQIQRLEAQNRNFMSSACELLQEKMFEKSQNVNDAAVHDDKEC